MKGAFVMRPLLTVEESLGTEGEVCCPQGFTHGLETACLIRMCSPWRTSIGNLAQKNSLFKSAALFVTFVWDFVFYSVM